MLEAAQNNDWETVAQLFKGSVSLLEKDAQGKNLLHWAAIHGQAEFLTRHHALLEEDLVNTPDKNGHTPLYLATRHGHWDCVKQLLLAKANLQAPSPDGQSILKYWVTSISDPVLLRDLLSTQTPQVLHECLFARTQDLSLLHHATAAGQTKIVRWLLDQGNVEEAKDEEQHHHALDVNTSDPHGYTPLYHAIKYGQAETAGILVTRGAQLDRLNINGDSPIHHAMRNGQLAIAQQLTHHMLRTLNFDQRPEYNALSQAFRTLYAYHHRETAEQFFKQAQEKHEAEERQKQSDALLHIDSESEEKKEDEVVPIGPLPRKVVELQFERNQLGQALEQFYALLKALPPDDGLIPLILWALSETCLQRKHDDHAYEIAISYAASAIAHYQKFVKGTPQDRVGYEAMLTPQESRIILIYRQEILGQIDALDVLEQMMLPKYFKQMVADHRHQLKQDSEEGKSTAILLQENTDFFKQMSIDLWKKSWALAKQVAPCRYALMGLGSMSKQEMCPYSDLEFALLLEKDDVKTKQSFQPIVRLMHLLVIALGETPINIACQMPLSATVQGFHFDDGGNTPLDGNFVGTPQFLAERQYVEGDAYIIMRNVLRSTTFLYGHHPLYESYGTQLHKILSEKLGSFFSPTRSQLQAMEILKGALCEFAPTRLTQIRHKKGFKQLQIKMDLYRLPSQVINNLCLYYDISGNTTFEKIEGLKKAKKLHSDNAQHLSQLMEMALKLRLKTHLHYGTEEETVDYQALEEEKSLPGEAPLYVLTETERAELLNAYRILLPLESALKQFVDSKGEDNPLTASLLYSEEVFAKHPALEYHLKARSYEYLSTPEQALNSYRQALEKDPDNQEIHLHYVRYLASLQEMQQRQQETQQAKRYQEEIQKSLSTIVILLLIPKKGSPQLGHFVTCYRRLPFAVRVPFRHALLNQWEKMQKKTEEAFFTQLLKTLNEEPDEVGQRESWQQHKQEWKATLNSLVDDEQAAGAVSIYLVSSLLDEKGQKAIGRPLKVEVQRALLDEMFEFRPSVINGSQHHVVRLQIKRSDGSPSELYCKAYPEMPGMTYLIERLHHSLMGHGTCTSELVKIERPGKESIPLLISEGIPGHTLHEVLKKNPLRLAQLDHQAYSDLVLLAILTNPEDGLPTNYIVTPQGTDVNKLTLVSIDHDHALFPPYLLECVKAASQEESKHTEAEDAEEEKQKLKPKLQIKTILFCLDAMHKSIDPDSKDRLLHLRPFKVLSSVLRETQVQNDYYSQLFDPEMIKKFHGTRPGLLSQWLEKNKQAAENCTIPIPLKEGDTIKLYQKLHRLQRFLTDYPEATLLQCLLQIEPRVGMAYARALNDYHDPLERLLKLGEYPVNLQGQMVTNTSALKSLRIQTQQIGREYYADLKDLTPAQGLAELDLMTYQQDTLDSIRTEVMQGDLKRFLALKASEHKAAVVSGIDLRKEGIDWYQLDEAKQHALLQALKGVAFTHLNLSGCNVLTRKQLIDLLTQSPDCTVLEINGHLTLDDFWLLAIASNARHLKELTIRQAPNLRHVRNTATLRHLNTLNVAHNPVLQTLAIKAPQLKYLQVKYCPKLSVLKTGSRQLCEIDATHDASLHLTKEVGHLNSACTLNSLKLSGCTHVKDSVALSAYPFLLWSSISEKAQVKVIFLLDQYLGQLDGWHNLLEEQRKQVIAKAELLEYDENYLLTLAFSGLKDENSAIRAAAQRTLAALASNQRLSKQQVDQILPAATSDQFDEDLNVREAVLQVLTALAGNAHLSEQQVTQILNAARYGIDGEGCIIEAAQQTLAALISHSRLSGQKVTEIICDVCRDIKSVCIASQRPYKRILNTILTNYPCLSDQNIAQIKRAGDSIASRVYDEDLHVQEAAKTASAILQDYLYPSSCFSDQQLSGRITSAVSILEDQAQRVRRATIRSFIDPLGLFGYDDYDGHYAEDRSNLARIRRDAQKTLTTLANHSSLSDQQVAQIFATATSGLKDEVQDVRKQARRVLSALSSNPRLSKQHVVKLLATLMSGLKDGDWGAPSAAQQALGALAGNSHLSKQQVAQIFAAAISSLKDPNEYSTARQAAQKTLATLASHSRLSDQQIAQIITDAISGLKAKKTYIQQSAQGNLIQQAKSCSLNQLPRYITWANSSIQNVDRVFQLAAASILAIGHQRCGDSLESYLPTLQVERKQQTSADAHASDWLEGGVYEQLEAQVIDFYVPDQLQQYIKAYEDLTKTAARKLKTCKVGIEFMAAFDDVKGRGKQQQFFAHQQSLFEQYHAAEQERIAEFQSSLREKPEMLTEETLAAAQSQFMQARQRAKSAFRATLYAFCEQSNAELDSDAESDIQRREFLELPSDIQRQKFLELPLEQLVDIFFCNMELDNDAKSDISELLIERRKFLELHLEQLDILSSQQYTLFTEWYRDLKMQQQTLLAPKQSIILVVQFLKKLSYDEDQLTCLRREIQALNGQVSGGAPNGNQMLDDENERHIQQLQRHQEILLQNQEQTKQLIEAIAAIEQTPALQAFYRCVQIKLGECFLAAKILASTSAVSDGKFDLPNTISVAGAMLPIPYAALVSMGIGKCIDLTDEHNVNHASTLVRDLIEMDQLAEKVARLLTWRYETQLQKLTRESAILLGESSVACMIMGLHSEQAFASDKLPTEKIIQAIYQSHYTFHLSQQTLETISGDQWTTLSVLLKPGIALWDKERLTLSFHSQEDKTEAIATEAEKYGYRLGSLQEVMGLSLRMIDDAALEREPRVGLRFIEGPQKRRNNIAPVTLRELPQEAAENPEDALEQKDEEVTAALADAAASVEPAEPNKSNKRSTKHVRFLDEVTIIPDDGVKQSASTSTAFIHTTQLTVKQSEQSKSSFATAMANLGVFTSNQSDASDEKVDPSQTATPTPTTQPPLHQKLIQALEKWDLEEAIKRSLNEEELQRSIQSMQARAKHFGYRCLDVKRDGRCFYHALILQLSHINPGLYQDLTVQTCLEKMTQHIIENQDFYEQFIDQAHSMNLDQFLDAVLKNDGTFWADDILISAAARTFNVDLIIVPNDGNQPFVSRRRDPEGLIYLGHEVEQHYQALEQDPMIEPQETLDAYVLGSEVDELERASCTLG